MAHFAKIENSIVTDLIVVDNSDCGGGVFPGSEPVGQAFISSLAVSNPRLQGVWVQTSFNTHDGLHYPSDIIEYQFNDEGEVVGTNGVPEGAFRGNFGEIGYTFDPAVGSHGEFFPPEGNE
jgi:hypothetical protein